MNPIADEIKSYLGVSEDESLQHYGMPRRSGRYPWGSGDDPYQRGQDFLGRVEELRKSGWQETPDNIMNEFGLTTTEYRREKSTAKNERRMYRVSAAKALKEKGLSDSEIGRQFGVNESTVRSWFNKESEDRMNKSKVTADMLKDRLKEVDGGFIDVGSGAEREFNISRENMENALHLLKREGYEVYSGRIPQPTNPDQQTTQKVLCPPGTKHSEIYDYDRVHAVKDYITRDGGETFEKKFYYPESMDSKRLKIRYSEEGGVEKDGIVELRRNVPDLSLGESRYAQVRILVDGTHYIKGMAVYSDDMPKGVDVVFNTNKKKGTPVTDVLKKIKDDPDNPFGSLIKDADQGGQYFYTDKDGNKKLGLINKRSDEGDWSDWKDTLPSQFLGKQSLQLAKKQLNIAKADKQAEFDDICALNNPTVKKHLLEEFASNCDSAAVHLKAASLPGQKYRVMIPINSLKDTEVYAPTFENGTKLALIRYPHGGTFEIPILTVNNKHAGARKVLDPDITDAVGVNKKVADRLSGADFDGDTVMCIPTHDSKGRVKIKSTPALKGLEDFEPKTKYGAHRVETDEKGNKHYFQNDIEYPIMTKRGTQTQMGIISNLITDMTLAGANDTEKAAAVRHSMVVIDAEKHKLNYKQSEIDNNIAALHERYQGKKTGGAATILSRAKGQQSVDKRQGSPHVNIKGSKDYDPTRPEGALIYKTSDDLYYTTTKVNKRTGEVKTVTKKRTQQSTKMAETDDAYTLVSDARHPMELVYADYANSMKAMGNKARVEMASTGSIKKNPKAAETYKKEVASLNSKLNDALLNAPREREALRKTNAEIKRKEAAGVFEDKNAKKKATQRALTKYRSEVGSVTRKNRNILITDKEWEAIQAGAISENKLKQILNNSDTDRLRQLATPRTSSTMSTSKISRAKSMSNLGYSTSEIANKLGVSASTVSKYLKGAN